MSLAWMGLHVSRGLLPYVYVNRRGGEQPLVFLQLNGLYGLLVLHVWGGCTRLECGRGAWFASHAGAVHNSVDVQVSGEG